VRDGRAGSPRSAKNYPMSSEECQAEEHSYAIGILIYVYESKTPNEKLLLNAWRQAEIKIKIQQQDKNSMLGCETVVMGTPKDEIDCETNT